MMNQSYHIQCARGLLDKSHKGIRHLPILLFKHGNLLLISNHGGIFLVLEEILQIFEFKTYSTATIRAEIAGVIIEVIGNATESRSESSLEGFQRFKSTINCYGISVIVGNIGSDGCQL